MTAPFTTSVVRSGTAAVTLHGPARWPKQMLAEQSFDGHSSIHDGGTADRLGLPGAPIEAPTHFSQFDPLAFELWGREWFESGCISAHFRTMVVEGEQVTARMSTVDGSGAAEIEAVKDDGSVVLVGSASVAPHGETALEGRLASQGDPGELFILDRLEVGTTSESDDSVTIDRDTPNGDLYPFSLGEKLAAITEPCTWYDSADGPWDRAILPFEMVSVLTAKTPTGFAVRGPALGLFLDLEVRMLAGPVFVGRPYRLRRRIVGLGQSRRTESYWVRTTVVDDDTGGEVASVLLNSGVFKESFAGYPADRIG